MKGFRKKPASFDKITGPCSTLINEYLAWARGHYPRPIYSAKKAEIREVVRQASLTGNNLSGFLSQIIELTKIGDSNEN